MKENKSALNKDHSMHCIVRTAKHADIPGITQLIFAVCEAEGDTATAVTEEELINEWEFEGFDPQKDAFVAETDNGELLGYAAVYDVDQHSELSGDIYLHPNTDIPMTGKALLQAMQNRSCEHVPLAAQGKPVFLRVALDNRNQVIKTIFTDMGYQAIRYHWRMEITFDQPPAFSDFSDEVTLKPFDWKGHAHAVWQARNAAFSKNWGSHELSFEEFSYFTKEHPEFDPTLWLVAWQGDQVVGFCINHMKMGIGWIHILGVVPEWRGKGIGKNLLQLAFHSFYQRDINVIGLGVDAANESGATKLYESAGMKPVSEFVTFEKTFSK